MSTSRILIVDDNPLNVKLLAAKLAGEGYELIRSYSGKDALIQAEKQLPDLILLDIVMPEIDGYQVTKRLKSNPKTSDIPIVLVTALDESEDKIKGLEVGADEFLNKPVDTSELRARIHSLLSLKQYGDQFQAHFQSESAVSTNQREPEFPSSHVVLIAEDDEASADLMLEYLHNKPYQIEVFYDGGLALKRTKQGDVDLILLDLSLPGLDGFEVCRRLKENLDTRNIQVIMITGHTDTESKVRGLEMGTDDFLIKPINREVLNARIRALLRKKDYFDRLACAYEQTVYAAITDKLTGLYNHSYFKRFLELEIERSRRQRHALTLLFLDIDEFQRYNDVLGRPVGDLMLKEISRLIRQNIRKIDMAARYGGEEFMVVLPYTDIEGALSMAHRIRKIVNTHPVSCKPSLPEQSVTVSIGIAVFDYEVTTPGGLIDQAQEALYQAKSQGKNRVCVFSRIAK